MALFYYQLTVFKVIHFQTNPSSTLNILVILQRDFIPEQ